MTGDLLPDNVYRWSDKHRFFQPGTGLLNGRRNPLIHLHGTSGCLSVSGKTADPSRNGLTADHASYIPDAIPVPGTVLGDKSGNPRPFNDRVVHRFRKVHKAVYNPMEICSSHQYVGIFLNFVSGRVTRIFKAKRKTEQCSVFLI